MSLLSNLRLLARTEDNISLDPFQLFQVAHDPCLKLQVTIHWGENITKGHALHDYLDTPDPYIVLKVPGSGNTSQRTTQLDNTTVPKWDETFHFFLAPDKEHNLHVTLMDANYTLDEALGEDSFIVNTLTNDIDTMHTFVFAGGSKIYTTLMVTKDKSPDLRFSLALCEKEREFLRFRLHKVRLGLQKLLGADALDSDEQAPTIAILGSGGGFRAMICMSGAMHALHKIGVLKCVTYISGLSGSSWYISNLYSHNSLPNVNYKEIRDNMRESVTSGWLWKLFNSLGYLSQILKKYKNGQPVSFTDYFGHLLGDILLQDRKGALLTDQRHIVEKGAVPFPLYTCLHAKRSVSARNFSEWIEFSPYEIGIAKYGTFMKSEDFGSKFIVGRLIKKYTESPLHYLQGVWGSAFTILFKRLVFDGSNKRDMVQIMRDHQREVTEREMHDRYDNDLQEQIIDSDTEDEDDIIGEDDINLEDPRNDDHGEKSTGDKNISVPCEGNQKETSSTGIKPSGTKKWAERSESRRAEREENKIGVMGWLKNCLLTGSYILNNRNGRAGEILNPFRGLSFKKTFPISPFAECFDEVDSASGLHQKLDDKAKKLFVVDSGLAFNSPFPILLRPQRAVDIFLSFDFSMRETDATLPFDELLLAEKWAYNHRVPFPPIQKQVELYKDEGFVREVYVFKDEDIPLCPVVLHFPLVNHNFRKFKEPGVKRETDEDLHFGDFHIFDDDTNVYSSTNFVYDDIQFDRLTQLTEFNTLFCEDVIKEEIANAVQVQKSEISKIPVSVDAVSSEMEKLKNAWQCSTESGLRMNISPDLELLLLNMVKERERKLTHSSADHTE